MHVSGKNNTIVSSLTVSVSFVNVAYTICKDMSYIALKCQK